MSYEYKEEILLDIGPAPSYNYPSEAANYYAKINELDHVYAQAAEYKEYRADTEKLYNALKAKGEEETLKYKAKADEYEAKAKAFDRIVEQRKETGVITLGHYAFEIIKEYESGKPKG